MAHELAVIAASLEPKVVVGSTLDDHELDVLRAEPFGCAEGIVSVLVELTGFQTTRISMINDRDKENAFVLHRTGGNR